MNPRDRFRTCANERIRLTDDAKAVCARTMDVAPGERIPGSKHKCGFLGMFVCFQVLDEYIGVLRAIGWSEWDQFEPAPGQAPHVYSPSEVGPPLSQAPCGPPYSPSGRC